MSTFSLPGGHPNRFLDREQAGEFRGRRAGADHAGELAGAELLILAAQQLAAVEGNAGPS